VRARTGGRMRPSIASRVTKGLPEARDRARSCGNRDESAAPTRLQLVPSSGGVGARGCDPGPYRAGSRVSPVRCVPRRRITTSDFPSRSAFTAPPRATTVMRRAAVARRRAVRRLSRARSGAVGSAAPPTDRHGRGIVPDVSSRRRTPMRANRGHCLSVALGHAATTFAAQPQGRDPNLARRRGRRRRQRTRSPASIEVTVVQLAGTQAYLQPGASGGVHRGATIVLNHKGVSGRPDGPTPLPSSTSGRASA